MSDTEDTEATEATEAQTEETAATESTTPAKSEPGEHANLDFLLDVPVRLTAELGSCQMTMHELLDLELGSVVQLDQLPDSPTIPGNRLLQRDP